MTRLGDALRDLRSQVEAMGSGSSDRPTSLYQSGSVGNGSGTRERPTRRSTESAEDERRRPERDVEVQRRTTTVVGVRRPPTSLRAMLATPQSLRNAVVIGEILGPPVSMRDTERRK